MPFLVAIEGECIECGQKVRKNTQAQYTGGGNLLHYPSCPPPPKICDNCFEEVSVTGKCSCE